MSWKSKGAGAISIVGYQTDSSKSDKLDGISVDDRWKTLFTPRYIPFQPLEETRVDIHLKLRILRSNFDIISNL